MKYWIESKWEAAQVYPETIEEFYNIKYIDTTESDDLGFTRNSKNYSYKSHQNASSLF